MQVCDQVGHSNVGPPICLMTKVVIMRIIALLQINVCNATLFNEIKHGYIIFLFFINSFYENTRKFAKSHEQNL